MNISKTRSIAAGVAALAALSLATGQVQASPRSGSPTLQPAPQVEILPNPAPGTLRPMPDMMVLLHCLEVGNGDVATTVRLTNPQNNPTVPAGSGVAIYGSSGQYVTSHTLAGSLSPGAYVDVQVVPWQAVYQGCTAQTSV